MRGSKVGDKEGGHQRRGFKNQWIDGPIPLDKWQRDTVRVKVIVQNGSSLGERRTAVRQNNYHPGVQVVLPGETEGRRILSITDDYFLRLEGMSSLVHPNAPTN